MDALLAFALCTYLVYAAVIVLTSPGGSVNEFIADWVYVGLFVLSVAIAGARAVLIPKDRLAWSVITLSLATWCFAEIYDVALDPTAYPSPADVGWLVFYPLLYAGIVLLVRRRARSIAGHLWLDGAIASAAALAELERQSGSQFDPEIAQALVAHVLEAIAGRAA